MGPKQALMWFNVILIIGGVLYTVVAFSIKNSVDSAFPGMVMALIGIILAFIAKKIKW